MSVIQLQMSLYGFMVRISLEFILSENTCHVYRIIVKEISVYNRNQLNVGPNMIQNLVWYLDMGRERSQQNISRNTWST